MKWLRGRAGMYFVEASLVYPLVVIITVTFITLGVHFYMKTAEAAYTEMESRRLLDGDNGTVSYNSLNRDSISLDLEDRDSFMGVSPEGARLSEDRKGVNEARLIWTKQLLN